MLHDNCMLAATFTMAMKLVVTHHGAPRITVSCVLAVKVLIEIIGKTATSGAVVVSSRRQGLLPFRAGCGTTTVLAKVPFVGPLVELRVTIDGSGIFPGWHLKCDTRAGFRLRSTLYCSACSTLSVSLAGRTGSKSCGIVWPCRAPVLHTHTSRGRPGACVHVAALISTLPVGLGH